MMRKLLIKKKNKGFTLTEILAVLVILGIIIAIAVPSVSKLQERFKKEYYSKLDDTVLEAGKMYYKDNSNSRPVNILEYTTVDIVNDNNNNKGLIANKYLESAYEYNTENNCEGEVVITKVNDGYLYKTCMECGEKESSNYYKSYEEKELGKNNINNLCHFNNSKIVYDIPTKKDMYIHVGNYTPTELKDELCISKNVYRVENDINDISNFLYTAVDENKENKVCPQNITGIDSKTTTISDRQTTVKYDDGKTRNVIVYQHPKPSIKKEDKVIVDGNIIRINKNNNDGSLTLYLDNNKFDSPYNSSYSDYQYFIEGTDKWENLGCSKNISDQYYQYSCTINSDKLNEMNGKNVKFRVIGTYENKIQYGNEANYRIIYDSITINIPNCTGTSSNSFKASYGFTLPSISGLLQTETKYVLNGYSYDDVIYYNSDGSSNKISIFESDVTLKAICSEIPKGEPYVQPLMTDSHYNVIADCSNIKINNDVYFNAVILNNDVEITSVTIDYGDGTTDGCNMDTNEDFFNAFTQYSGTYTRYYCKVHSYSNSGTYNPKISITYKETSTVNKTITKDLELNVPTISVYYKASSGTIAKVTANVNYWKLDSFNSQNDFIYYSSNGSAYAPYVETIPYGGTYGVYGLVDYNNSNFLNVSRVGYSAQSGAEWKCVSGCSVSNKVFSQASNTNYSSDDFCSGSNGDCSVYLDVNWVPNTYSISYNLDGGEQASSGVPTSYTYGVGATINGKPTKSGYKFNGWSTSSSSSPSFSQTISKTDTENKTYYAKWCQNCSSVSNGSCSLNASTAGKCTYTTSCDTGYTLTSGLGTRNPVCTINKVKVRYHIPKNVCTITNGSSGNTWSINDDNLLTKNGDVYETTLNYGQTNGNLINYNNSDNFTVSCDGFSIPSGMIWRDGSDADSTTHVFSQTNDTHANDLCDASNEDCTKKVYLNRIQTPSCNITVDGTLGNEVGTKQWYKEENATISLDTTNAENNKTNDRRVTYGLSTESSPSTRYNGTSSLSQGSTQGTTYYGFVRRITNVGTIENTCEKTVYVDVDKPTVEYCSAIRKENLEEITGPRADGYVFFKCRYYDSTSYIDRSSGNSNYCYNVSDDNKAAFIRACSSTANALKAVCKNTTSVTASNLLVADSHVKLTNEAGSAALSWIGVSQYCYKNYALGIGYRFKVCDKAGNCRSSGYQYHEKK